VPVCQWYLNPSRSFNRTCGSRSMLRTYLAFIPCSATSQNWFPSLAPGEAKPWHRDPFQKVPAVLRGDSLSIEYHDGGESQRVEVTRDQIPWEEGERPRSTGGECRQATLRTRYRFPARPPGIRYTSLTEE